MSKPAGEEKLHVDFVNDDPDALTEDQVTSKPPSVNAYSKAKWKIPDKVERKNSLNKAGQNSIFSLANAKSYDEQPTDPEEKTSVKMRQNSDLGQRFGRTNTWTSAVRSTKNRLSVDTFASIKTRIIKNRTQSEGSGAARLFGRQSMSSAYGMLNSSINSTSRGSLAGNDSVFETVVAGERTIKRWSSRVRQGQGDLGSVINTNRRTTSKHSESDSELKVPAIETFRRVARLVRLLCSVTIALRNRAIGKGLLDNYLVSISHRTNIGKSGNDTDDLTFNLENFKIKKEPEVPESAKVILAKRPDDRTPSDIEAILRLMRELASFRKYTREMQQLFCRIVRYMRCNQNRVVLRKGHVGYNLYFIFTGTCSVVLDKDEKSVFVKKEVIVLRKGACFGEIALVQNTRRNATVVCAQDTEFLVVDKDLFLEKGLNHQVEEEFRFRFNVFRGLKFISHWNDERVRELSNISRMEEFGYNRIVVKDSKLNDWLWFVVKGSCDIIRLVDLEKCASYKRLINDPSPESRVSLENLAAASRGAFVCTDTETVHSETSLNTSSEDKASFSKEEKFFKRWKQKDKMTDLQSNGKSEIDIGRIDDMLANLRNNQVSEVMLALTERAREAKEKEKEKEKEAEILDALQEPGSGLFFKVDTLRDCQCFGMETIIPKKKPTIQGLESMEDDYEGPSRTFTLVSRGCEVIHVPKTRFVEIADKDTMANITKAWAGYPEDDVLCQRFIERCNWDAYKSEVVEDVMIDKERSKGFEAGLRTGNLKGQDIARAKKTGDGTEYHVFNTEPPATSPRQNQTPNHQRPHTAFARRKKGADSKKSLLKSSWQMDLDMMKGTSASRNRPSTCPPRVSKQKLFKKRLAQGPADSGRIPMKPDGSGATKASSVKVNKGYQVEGTNVYVRGSHRSLQVIAGIRSPKHEFRLNKLGIK